MYSDVMFGVSDLSDEYNSNIETEPGGERPDSAGSADCRLQTQTLITRFVIINNKWATVAVAGVWSGYSRLAEY